MIKKGKTKACFFYLALFALTSCMTQSPAPIEFKDTQTLTDTGIYTLQDSKQEVTSVPINDLPKEKQGLAEYENIPPLAEEKPAVEPLESKESQPPKLENLESELSSILDEKQAAKHKAEPKLPSEKQVTEAAPYEQDAIPQAAEQEPIAEVAAQKTLPGLAAPLIKPVDGKVVEGFSSTNQGINIAAALGSQVKAVYDGQVVYAGYDERFGNLIITKLKGSDLFVAYAHLDELILDKGASVLQGQEIGYVGQSGSAKQPQLYLAIKQGKIAVDPSVYLPY